MVLFTKRLYSLGQVYDHNSCEIRVGAVYRIRIDDDIGVLYSLYLLQF
jgi:hypothetical protein